MAPQWMTCIVVGSLCLGYAELTSPGELASAGRSPSLSSDQAEDTQATNQTKTRVFNIETSLTKGSHSVAKEFLSICIPSKKFKMGSWLNFMSRIDDLKMMAAPLSPSHLRIGGTIGNFLTFSPDGSEIDNTHDIGNQNVKYITSGEQWRNMSNFAKSVGWDIVWQFNYFKRTNDEWDPSNAALFLNYSDANGIEIPAFELGNEPNNYKKHFNFVLSRDRLLKDYRILKDLLLKYPRYSKSKIFGPDTANVWGSAKSMINRLVQTDARDVIDVITLHHYYMPSSQATVETFTTPKTLDRLKFSLSVTYKYIMSNPPLLPVQLTETSSAYGGGKKHITDAYVAGFLWLDKLGLSAQYGVEALYRQVFFGGKYALLDSTLFPNPDYYLSVLFKRLVEGPVLQASSKPASPDLRLYSNCARRDLLGYPRGAVVFYYLNLSKEDITLSMTQSKGHQLDLFLLTPGDEEGQNSRFVKLNGKTLRMSDSGLPPMNGAPHTGDVTVSGQSFGFIVDRDAKAQACL